MALLGQGITGGRLHRAREASRPCLQVCEALAVVEEPGDGPKHWCGAAEVEAEAEAAGEFGVNDLRCLTIVVDDNACSP